MTCGHLKTIQKGLSPEQRLNQIVTHSMCIGCGICQSLAGPDRISMEIAANGNYRPIVNDVISHDLVDRIMDVCPGTRVDGLPQKYVDGKSKVDLVWGVWHEIFYAWAAEPEVRYMSATAGVLTGLALYLLESGEVDFIVHAREHEDKPAFGMRHISRTREDVLKGSGSRYGPTATLIDIIEIIEEAEKHDERFAFIGTPCDVSALRNYARRDSRVDVFCKYMLTMVCGGFMEAEGAKTVLAKFNVDYDEVTSLRYRGYGCPGPTAITTKDGRKVEMNYLDYWGEDDSTWGLPPRCKVCPDGIGDSADIAAADTWDGGSPAWEGQDEDPGFNAAIVRTAAGFELINNAIAAGYLCKGEAMTPADMNRVQPHQEKKKRSVWARFRGLKAAGQVYPETHGLRLKELYECNDDDLNREQQAGTERRASMGKFSEAAPEKTAE